MRTEPAFTGPAAPTTPVVTPSSPEQSYASDAAYQQLQELQCNQGNAAQNLAPGTTMAQLAVSHAELHRQLADAHHTAETARLAAVRTQAGQAANAASEAAESHPETKRTIVAGSTNLSGSGIINAIGGGIMSWRTCGQGPGTAGRAAQARQTANGGAAGATAVYAANTAAQAARCQAISQHTTFAAATPKQRQARIATMTVSQMHDHHPTTGALLRAHQASAAATDPRLALHEPRYCWLSLRGRCQPC